MTNAAKATTTTVKCLGCGRPLRSLKSIARGRGAHCARKITLAAKTVDLTDVKPAQVDAARELIDDGGIVPIHRGRAYQAVSSDGERTYLTAPSACTCPSGLRGRTVCLHRVAARLLAAA